MIVIHDCRVNNRIADSERAGRDRIVVSTSRCCRDNPGSNPGHGIDNTAVCPTQQLPSSYCFGRLLYPLKFQKFQN